MRGGQHAENREKGLGGLSRRRFLRNSAIGAAGLAAGPRAWAGREVSKVVRTTHPEATTGWTTVNQEPVDQMVHAAVRELTGFAETGEAYKSLFPGITAEKVISIKINLACGDVPTHPEVINAIIDGLLMMDLGGETLPPENIIVWDLDTAFMCPQTGYVVNWGGAGVQYVGSDHGSIGWDYSQVFTVQHSTTTTNHRVSRIISEFSDYIINAAVLKDHDDWAGVTLGMKNWYGAFDNIPITHMHYQYFVSGIPGLSMILRDELADKVKLHLIDGTFCLYNGGPGYTPPWHTPPNWIYNSVLMSTDVVALDRIGTEKINAKRIEMGLGALDPDHITAAGGAPYNLGNSDLANIDLVEIDVSTQGVAAEALRTYGIALLSPYPNPARGACTLRLQCTAATDAEIVITDVNGAVVRRISAAHFAPGVHRLPWNGRDESGRKLPSGNYFCRLITAVVESRQRIVLVH